MTNNGEKILVCYAIKFDALSFFSHFNRIFEVESYIYLKQLISVKNATKSGKIITTKFIATVHQKMP